MSRTVILLSPHFPPNPLAGVHRARHLAKHLPAHGWRPIVVRAEDAAYVERLDPALAALVPDSVEQVKVKTIDPRLARLVGFGDIGLRGYRQFAAAIDDVVRDHQPAAVFVTGGPYYHMLLAGRVKRRHGIPVVADFQDPWVSAHGATLPPFSRGGLAHRMAVMLEPRVVRASAFITSVSQIQNEQLAARYPWFDASAMAAIPIGADPEDFVQAASGQVAPRDPGKIVLRYVGAYWSRAEPCLRQFFRGVALLRASDPQLANRLQLEFIGTASSNQPNESLDRPVLRIAQREGVGELVAEHPQRAPFPEALRLMSLADGLLLIGSDEPHYTASKIYPALMSAKPYLALFHAQSSAQDVLRRAGGGSALAYDPNRLEDLPGQVAAALADLAARPLSFGPIDPQAYAANTAHAVAGQYADIFDRIAQTGGQSGRQSDGG